MRQGVLHVHQGVGGGLPLCCLFPMPTPPTLSHIFTLGAGSTHASASSPAKKPFLAPFPVLHFLDSHLQHPLLTLFAGTTRASASLPAASCPS